MRAAPGFVLSLLVCMLMGTAGCGTLYSETRDKQGQAAREAWQKVDLASQIAAPRKNHAALLDKQLQVEESLALARREQLARRIATGGTVEETLASPVREDLQRLAGGRDQAKQWLDALDDEAFARQALLKFDTEFQRFGLEMPPCDRFSKAETRAALDAWVAKQPAPRAQAVTAAIRGASTACDDKRLRATQSLSLGSSELQQTRDATKRATEALAAKRAASLDQRNLFRAAKAEYDAAAAALATEPTAARDRVQAAARKLQELAAQLSGLQDAFSVRFISQEQQKSLDELLSTILDTPAGTAPAADSSQAAVALVLLPDLIDSARTSLADARKPHLVPFVLAKDLARIRADAAARDVAAQETAVDLQRQKLSRQTERARTLRDADVNLGLVDAARLNDSAAHALSPVQQVPGARDKAASKVLDDKIRLWKAAAFYLHARGQLEADVGKVDYQVNALEYERALAYAESNVAQWNALISTSVDQMAAFGAAGIRSEDVVALLNSLTLLWIGKGVN
jgi:uncharacterized protein YceK